MLWSYVQLDDGTQFAYSETRDDGTVRKRSVYLRACRTAKAGPAVA